MSAHHHRSPLNGSRTRARKRLLAARDGAWCTYCGRLFADLQQATIDHVVPVSLFHTWRAEHTVLACKPCNDLKADRVPLLLALLLTADTGVGAHGESGAHAPTGRAFTVAEGLLLARLAHAAESAWWARELADASGEQSRDDQGGHRAHGAVRVLPELSPTPPTTLPAPRPACAPVPDRTARLDALLEAA